jgi:putative transposase
VLHRPPEPAEYTAAAYRAACDRLTVTQSMGRVGSALDNAVIESWHSTVEFELRMLEHFTTKAQARTRLAGWIQEYNHDRRHSSIGMISPVEYEQQVTAQDAAAEAASGQEPAA